MSGSSVARIRETVCVPGKIFYCNGMTASREEAQAHADEIQRVTQADVELHHNDTTSTEKTAMMGGKLIAGAGLMTYGVSSEKKTQEKTILDVFLGLVGLGVAAWGMNDYAEIQNQKNESAQQLTNKVISYLEQNPLSHVTLIFHSQGADIGIRALDGLTRYKSRIHVVTFGGMVDIPNDFASRVVNFVDDQDMIAHLAKSTFGAITKMTIGRPAATLLPTRNNSCQTPVCHGATDYLRTPIVRSTITNFSKSQK